MGEEKGAKNRPRYRSLTDHPPPAVVMATERTREGSENLKVFQPTGRIEREFEHDVIPAVSERRVKRDRTCQGKGLTVP